MNLNIDWGKKMGQTLNLEKYAKIARQAAAEGCVLLKNENHTLPLKKGDKVAVFGRSAFHYYKSGLGSGGLVNTRYVVSILDALKKCENISLEENLLHTYEEWIAENPADEGHGWGTVPWCQEEMPLTDDVVQSAKEADIALVIIGRTAGEDQDNTKKEGSYLLTETEWDMIQKVSHAFPRTAVLLNVGNIIDMSWVEACDPSAVMYVWQGGQEGGNGVLDVLLGRVNPCGKLTDTIAYDLDDYPSSPYFGDQKKNYYKEDIYVGYRYFETCAKEKVQYPFGFGLSYTKFEIVAAVSNVTKSDVEVKVRVKNTGTLPGKEVVQVYVKAPQGKLGKPFRVLAGFMKTNVIQPEQEEEMVIRCPKSYFASYDDAGKTGNRSCSLLEAGKYEVYAGTDVRTAAYCGEWMQDMQTLEQLTEVCASVEPFERFKVELLEDGSCGMSRENVPLRTVDPVARLQSLREKEIPYQGDQGYLLKDVSDGRVSLEQFIAQLSDDDLMCMFYGEGMYSLRVTPGTAAAFGGVTDSLQKYGIPAVCCADGPSGIRMDCGTKAFSIPNGTALGCTYNVELTQELFEMLGWEMRRNKIDTLLGPGINIHRNPLNGRNFEYFSEDPVLTGKMCVAQLMGLKDAGVSGTVKHFCANNQEEKRKSIESVISERALREIYLKGFEMAVREGNARSIMTSYGAVNGIWTAGNFDLCSVVLRNEWKYDGIVMTDWWAVANWEGEDPDPANRAPMVIAQNDLYMCCMDAEKERAADNLAECFENGKITRSDLQRNAKNILQFILKSPAMLRQMGKPEDEPEEYEGECEETDFSKITYYQGADENGKVVISGKEMRTKAGEKEVFGVILPKEGNYRISFRMKSELNELAQLPFSLYMDNLYRATISFQGSLGKEVERQFDLGWLIGKNHYFKLEFAVNGIEMEQIKIEPY